jgi:hypothetical protein
MYRYDCHAWKKFSLIATSAINIKEKGRFGPGAAFCAQPMSLIK